MTDILWDAFEIFSNFLDQFLFLFLVSHQLPEDKSHYMRDGIALCILGGILTIMKHLSLPLFVTVPIMSLAHFGYCLLTRRGVWWQLALWPFVARLAYFCIDQAVTIFASSIPGFSFQAMSGQTPLRFFGMCFYMFLSIIVFYLLSRMSPRNRSLPPATQAASIFTALICIFFAGLLFEFSPRALEQEDAWILNISFVGFIVTSISWLFILDALSARNAEVLALQAERQYVEDEHHFFESMQAMYNRLSAIKHDSLNQMLALSGLVKQGDLHGLEEHLAQLQTEMDPHTPLTLTKFPQLDAILSIKLQQAIEYHIKTEWLFIVPDELPLPIVELCSIMGNILDNALEATQQVPEPERFLQLKSGTASNMWYIRVKNTSLGNYKRDADSQEFRTTKDRGRHGIGLKRVTQLAEKNNGYVLIDAEKTSFAITIFLPWQKQKDGETARRVS